MLLGKGRHPYLHVIGGHNTVHGWLFKRVVALRDDGMNLIPAVDLLQAARPQVDISGRWDK